jgi:hypothetical protein
VGTCASSRISTDSTDDISPDSIGSNDTRNAVADVIGSGDGADSATARTAQQTSTHTHTRARTLRTIGHRLRFGSVRLTVVLELHHRRARLDLCTTNAHNRDLRHVSRTPVVIDALSQ